MNRARGQTDNVRFLTLPRTPNFARRPRLLKATRPTASRFATELEAECQTLQRSEILKFNQIVVELKRCDLYYAETVASNAPSSVKEILASDEKRK